MLRSLTNTPPANWILAALPSRELQRLAPQVQPCSFTPGQILHDEGDTLQYVYFLDNGLVSLVLSSNTGQTVEVGMVGCHGLVGTQGVAGLGRAFSQAVVQTSGRGWRMPLDAFQREFKGNLALHNLTIQHLELLHLQAAQTALCNQLHSVEERLCRWLLMARNCTRSESLPFTHESISYMLGVRRSGITTIAHKLQEENLISYTRGHIQILHHVGLAQKACPCYEVLRMRLGQFYVASQQSREYALN